MRELPATAQLSSTYDSDALRQDLSKLVDATWSGPRAYSGAGLEGQVTGSDWTSLPLRSVNGDASRSDPGGPGLSEFANTKWLDPCPYISDVLDSLPAPLRAVRLMQLGPGAESPWHLDTKIGLPWGKLRLHIPIIVPEGAELLVQDESHRWSPGGLFYADFSRLHKVRNSSDYARVHLVIDSHVTPKIMELFPKGFQAVEVKAATLYAQPVRPPEAGCDAIGNTNLDFELPQAFLSYEEPNDRYLEEQDRVPASIGISGGRVYLSVDGEKRFLLEYVGDGEFRYAGWTGERGVRVVTRTDGLRLIELLVRSGPASRSLAVVPRGGSDMQ